MASELPHDYYNNPPAYMGFVGFVRLKTGNIPAGTGGSVYSHRDMIVRATTADINVSQEITKPDIIDSRYDKTVYQLGPKLIDGSISFPAVYDQQGGANIVEALYRYAITRGAENGLLTDFDLDVKYATTNDSHDGSFIYNNCIVNTFQFSVSHEDVVNISVDLIGLTRALSLDSTSPSATDLTNTRIVTWNDARVEIRAGTRGEFGIIGGEFVRTFEANINNAAERFYTLNKNLFPQAIAPTKRDIDGSMEILGRHKDLATLAFDNQNYCSEDTSIAFGFVPKATIGDCDSTFSVLLPNCILEIEEMSLSSDLFVTSINWHSLPAAGTGIDDPLIQNLNNVTFSY